MKYLIYTNFYNNPDIFYCFREQITLYTPNKITAAIIIQYHYRQYHNFKQIIKTIMLIDKCIYTISLNFFTLRNYLVENIPRMKKKYRQSPVFNSIIFMLITYHKNRCMKNSFYMFKNDMKMIKEIEKCYNQWVNRPIW